MADQNVELNAGDNKSQDAYEMTRKLWYNEFDRSPKMSDEKFYHLVHECWRCLNHYGPGRFTDNAAK